MKIRIIPDVHGHNNWKEHLPSISDDNKIIFMGDYVDSWGVPVPDQIRNLIEIICYKKMHKSNMILLLGNHDWSYLTRTSLGENVSGHSKEHHFEIKDLFLKNIDLFDLAYQDEDWVFSHAGFSIEAVENFEKKMNVKLSVETLNNMFHSFENLDTKFDECLDWNGRDLAGEDTTQFCLWIRPASLLLEPYFNKQIVGHTEICLNENLCIKDSENIVVFTDSATHDSFGDCFDTSEKNIKTISYKEWLINREKIHREIFEYIQNYHITSDSLLKDTIQELFGEKYAKNYHISFLRRMHGIS